VAWRRPTLPRLETQYHGRWGVSRPCSGWERVYQPRDGHQATGPDPLMDEMVSVVCVTCFGAVRGGWRTIHAVVLRDREFYWAIRIARLRGLPRFHLRPIDVLVLHGPWGDLVLRLVSRLDAFSGYPFRTWLPGDATGVTTGAPEVRPSRSSRTRERSSQVSNTHGR
jgi:hypothetical protein